MDLHPHGRRRGSGLKGDGGHDSCLDSGDGKAWAQIQTRLTDTEFGHTAEFSHFHIYKMVTNISLEICWVSMSRQTREVFRRYQAHSKCLMSTGSCFCSPLFWKARPSDTGKQRHTTRTMPPGAEVASSCPGCCLVPARP